MRSATTTRDTPGTIKTWWVFLALLVSVVAAYHATWRAPFVFDDEPTILDNPSVRSLWPLSIPLSPPDGGLPVTGRPIPNLTLALNFALSGPHPWSYHAVNIALHIAAACLLFSLLRDTLSRPVVPERMRAGATELAGAVTLLWALHPLVTTAVTYTTQRTEVLASLFCLLTLHAFARAARPDRLDRRWAVVTWIACLLGMASKEVMAATPLLVLLYDRTFVAGSFGTAWRARWRLHIALMTTWLLLSWLVVGSATRGGTAGFGVGPTPLAYALTQSEAITRYLGLALWPRPLVFDYGDMLTTDWRVFVPLTALVATLVGLTILGLWRRPMLAFPAAVFFAVLAPSSSVVPVVTQTMGEHRMYLPLAAVLTLVGTGLHALLGRRAAVVLVAAACLAGGLSYARNADYVSAESLWRDTIEKRPGSARAHSNLATLLFERGDIEAGLAPAREALRLSPGYVDAMRNLARALLQLGRVSEARAHAEEAQRLAPASASGWVLLGQARDRDGQPEAARAAFDEALRLKPGDPEALLALADANLRAERLPEAIATYRKLLRDHPKWIEVQIGLGNALLLDEHPAEALACFDAALALAKPTPTLLTSRGIALAGLDRIVEAHAAFLEALKLDPTHAPARQMLDELR